MARGAALANARIIGRKREEQQVAINIYLRARAAYSARESRSRALPQETITAPLIRRSFA